MMALYRNHGPIATFFDVIVSSVADLRCTVLYVLITLYVLFLITLNLCS